MKKHILLPVLTLLLGSFFLFVSPPVQRVGATNLPKVTLCHHTSSDSNTWVTIEVAVASVLTHLGHGDTFGACVNPSPTPTVSPTPSVSPSPTPSESPTPTPTETPNPCDQEVVLLVLTDNDEVPCVTPTPTATPSATPTPEVRVFSEPQPAGAPVCTDKAPSKIPNIFVVQTPNRGELEVRWTPSGGTRAHIFVALRNPDGSFNEVGAKLDTVNDGVEVIDHLVSGTHYWFRVVNGDGCAWSDPSDWFDPVPR